MCIQNRNNIVYPRNHNDRSPLALQQLLRISLRFVLFAAVSLYACIAAALPNLAPADCSSCHGPLASMTTTPVSGGMLSFGKTLIGKSSTATFTISNNSTTTEGGGFTGSFPAATAPFSPNTTQVFNVKVPNDDGASSYAFILPPPVVANPEYGGTSSTSRVYSYTPTVRGTNTNTIVFTPSAGFLGTTTPSSSVSLSGQGVAPVISLITSNTAAGNVRIGTSGTASFTVKNIGDGNQAGGGLGNLTGTASASAGSFTGPGGSFNLADSGSLSFSYSFSPSAHAAASASIAVNATDGSSDGRNLAQNQSVTITGTGVGPAVSSSLPTGSTLNFGALVTSQTSSKGLTVANLTSDANLGALTNLDILSMTLSGAGSGSFQVTGVTAGTNLSKSQSATMQVEFTPPLGVEGFKNATLTILTDQGAASGSAGQSLSFTLTGDAIWAAYFKGTNGSAWNTTSPGSNWTLAASSSTPSSLLPDSFSDVFMPANGATNLHTTLGQNFSIRSLNFTSGTSSISIGGSNSLTLANGITEVAGSAAKTISANLVLGGSQIWNVAGTLDVSGAISGPPGASLLMTGGGTLVLSGSDSYSGGTLVTAGELILADPTSMFHGSELIIGSSAAISRLRALTEEPPAGEPTAASVPEPSALSLLAAELLLLFGCRRRARRSP